MSQQSHGGFTRLRPLAEALGPFKGFREVACKQDLVHDTLARLAARAKTDKRGVLFHTVRETAVYFGVSLWTVGAVYRRLEREGTIVRIRGSRTIIPARRGVAPQGRVRGVIAIMVWLPGFLHVPDVRQAVMLAEERLRRSQFVADIVFYHEEDKTDPALAARVIAHEPDCVLWFTPKGDDRSVIETISDAGIRVVCIIDRPVKTRAPQYAISWRRGLRKVLKAWHDDGVRRVVVPVGIRRETTCTHVLEEEATAAGLTVEDYHWKGGDMESYVSELAALHDAGLVLDDDLWDGRLCTLLPRQAVRLLSRRHVLTPRTMPIDQSLSRSAKTEALIMPWPVIIDRIVTDLASGILYGDFKKVVFEADWRPNIPIREIARLNDYENAGLADLKQALKGDG